MYKKINGLVIGRNRFSEAHAYVKILTDEGIISFVGHGVMSPKNKSFSACQPYTFGEFVLKVTGERISLSEASAECHLIRQGADFEKISLANYVVEMARETSFDISDAPDILALTYITLHTIDRTDTPSDIVKAVFELRLASALGFMPDFSGCMSCEREITGGAFLISEGGFICSDCEREDVRAVKVTSGLVKALKHLFEISPKEAFGIRFKDSVERTAFTTLAERFSLEHLDSAHTALAFYKDNIKNF